MGVFQVTVTDKHGNVLRRPQVEVRDADDNLVDLFSESTLSDALTNPFNGDVDGFIRFYTEASPVKITVSKDGNSTTYLDVVTSAGEGGGGGDVNLGDLIDGESGSFPATLSLGTTTSDTFTVFYTASVYLLSPPGVNVRHINLWTQDAISVAPLVEEEDNQLILQGLPSNVQAPAGNVITSPCIIQSGDTGPATDPWLAVGLLSSSTMAFNRLIISGGPSALTYGGTFPDTGPGRGLPQGWNVSYPTGYSAG